MARTKQTARKSTAQKVPRKQLIAGKLSVQLASRKKPYDPEMGQVYLKKGGYYQLDKDRNQIEISKPPSSVNVQMKTHRFKPGTVALR